MVPLQRLQKTLILLQGPANLLQQLMNTIILGWINNHCVLPMQSHRASVAEAGGKEGAPEA